MIQYLIIIILSFICAALILYIIRKNKKKKHFLLSLNKIIDGEENKIFTRGKSVDSDIIYLVNKIIESFSNKIEEFEKKEATNSELLTGLSHDIRTPLASLIGYLDALNENILTEFEKKEYLEIVRKKAYDLKDYIDIQFDWFKLNSKEMIFESETLDINELIREILIDWIPVLSSNNITLKTDISQNSYNTLIDKKAFKRIINNLIQNSVVHSECTSLMVKTSVEDGKIYIKISDNGKGIENNKLPYIFNRLYKCDSSRKNKGNGLGLAIVKELVEVFNGSIEAVSIQNRETAFTVVLQSL